MRTYETPSITVEVLDIKDVIATSGTTLHFTETGEVSGQTTNWNSAWETD